MRGYVCGVFVKTVRCCARCVQLVGGQFEMESNFVINDPETILHMLTLMDSCSVTLQACHSSQ